MTFHLFISIIILLFMHRQVGFEPLRQFAAGEHDAMVTLHAFQTDICTEAHNNPLIRAAGMRFAQTQTVFYLQVRKHEKIIPP